MSPEKLDALIFAALSDGACPLPELARRVNHDAREVLRRLHALGGQKQVGTQMNEGSVEWFSRRADAPAPAKTDFPSPTEQPSPLAGINRAAVSRRAPRVAPARAPAPAEKSEEAPVELTKDVPAVAGKARRKRNQTIIVRQAVLVTELSVSPINGAGCLITDGEKIDPESVGDPSQVFVPTADIPGLIEALQQLLEVA